MGRQGGKTAPTVFAGVLFTFLACMYVLVVFFYVRGGSTFTGWDCTPNQVFPLRARYRSLGGGVPNGIGGGLKIFIYPLTRPIFQNALLKTSRERAVAQRSNRTCVCCSTSADGTDVAIYHNLLYSPFITTDAEKADYFFIPTHLSCLLDTDDARSVDAGLDPVPNLKRTSAFLADVLDDIRGAFPYWDRRGGEDHIWAFPHEFGAHLFGDVQKIRRSIFLIANGQYSESVFQPWKDIVVPGLQRTAKPIFMEPSVSRDPPAAFTSRGTLLFWRRPTAVTKERDRGIHQIVYDNLGKYSDVRVEFARGDISDEHLHEPAMRDALFCLCLEGHWAWTSCPFDAIFSGCIPVLVSEDLEYPFERFIDWRAFSVKVSPQRVGNVVQILRRISSDAVATMQTSLQRVWRSFFIPPSYKPRHAIDLIVRELAVRRSMMHPRTAAHRARRREYEEEWGLNGLQMTPQGISSAEALQRGTYWKEQSASDVIAVKAACDSGVPLRVRLRTAVTRKRTHCHGAAHTAGPRECTSVWPRTFNAEIASPSRQTISDSSGCRFDVVANAIMSTRSAMLLFKPSARSSKTITVVMQASVDGIVRHLPRFLSMWQGFVSIAVIVETAENEDRTLMSLVKTSQLVQKWVNFHFVYPQGQKDHDGRSRYPINILRNVAMQQAQTKWVLVLDIETIPSACMRNFLSQVENAEAAFADENVSGDCPGLVAYIPPALQFVSISQASALANAIADDTCSTITKDSAVQALRKGILRPMHLEAPHEHMPIRYNRWMSNSAIYEVPYSAGFAPYYITRRGAPLFNDTFTASDSAHFAQQVHQLFAAGYRFVVMHSVFALRVSNANRRARDINASFFGDAWKAFVLFSAELYGISPAFGALSSNDAARLSNEASAFVNSMKSDGKRQALRTFFGSRQDDNLKYTLIVTTYKLLALREIVAHYCKLPSLLQIVVVWNGFGQPVPGTDVAPLCNVSIHFRTYERNLPSNRYRPRNLPHDAPDPVFMVDEDIIIPLDTIEFAFRVWRSHREQVVGFFPSAALRVWSGSVDTHAFGGEAAVKAGHAYHFIHPNACFIHKKYLDAYWRAPAKMIQQVDATRSCDDLAVNFVVSAETSLPPVYVDGFSGKSFQESPEYLSERSKCINDFIRYYRQNPLIAGDAALRPVGKRPKQ